MSSLAQQWLGHYAARDKLFGVVSEAMWRMLLDLRHHNKPLTVTSCCIASGAPASTALRHLAELLDAGWVKREPNPSDQRSDPVVLTDFAREAFDRFEGWK